MKTEGLNMLKSILIKLYKCVHYWAVNSKMIVTWFVHVWLTLYDEHNSQNIYTVRNFNACPIAVLFLLEIWLEPIWWDQAFSWFFHLCKWCPLTMSLVGSLFLPILYFKQAKTLKYGFTYILFFQASCHCYQNCLKLLHVVTCQNRRKMWMEKNSN